MLIKSISSYFLMTFVIHETSKLHEFIYFEETFSEYATFYSFEMS